jgi:hypothetical protein
MKNRFDTKPDTGRCAVVASGEPGEILAGVAERLAAEGFAVDFLTHRSLRAPARAYKLIILRAKDAEVRAWAEYEQRRGSLVIPEPATIRTVKDRWACRQLLENADIRIPDAMLGGRDRFFDRDVRGLLPLVLKKRFVHGDPVKVFSRAEDFRSELLKYSPEDEFVAERYIDGMHYTLCFIGRQTFGFAKRPLDHGITRPVPSSNVLPEMYGLVDRYRSITNLYFGKLDLVVGRDSGIFMVDCGVSPNLWQIPNADNLLGNYMIDLLTGNDPAARQASTGPLTLEK